MNSSHNKRRVVIVAGLSGSGLATAIHVLEDLGYYGVDNLPITMLASVLAVLQKGLGAEKGIVFGLRIHSEADVDAFVAVRAELEKSNRIDLVFLTAEQEILIRRYSATRRKHPALMPGEAWAAAISREKQWLHALEVSADVVVDTSNFSPAQLGHILEARYQAEAPPRSLCVSITSFGFKYGQCQAVDSMFDVRFLNNPYFVPGLREKDGLSAEVKEYLRREPDFTSLIDRLVDWHCWLFPKYYDEGKHYFRVGIGCTGGKHRSVCVAEELGARLKSCALTNVTVTVQHRDLVHTGDL